MTDAAESAIEDLTLRAQYHVAVARGLVNEPAILMVENLDGTLAGEELDGFAALLRRVPAELGDDGHRHGVAPASRSESDDRVIEIAGGCIVRDTALLPEPEA